jgi:predicted  nucleic acid-binding Zn-ribbon protein
MAKRSNKEDMEIARDLETLKTQMKEVLFLLGGSASYEYKGLREDVKDLKRTAIDLNGKVDKLEKEYREDKKNSSFLSIKYDTIPQKVAAAITFLVVLLTAINSIVSLFTATPK